jgi:hypothetical protein
MTAADQVFAELVGAATELGCAADRIIPGF